MLPHQSLWMLGVWLSFFWSRLMEERKYRVPLKQTLGRTETTSNHGTNSPFHPNWGTLEEHNGVGVNSLQLCLQGQLINSSLHSLQRACPSSEQIFRHGKFHNRLYCRPRPLASFTLITSWKAAMWMFTVVMDPSYEVKAYTPITVISLNRTEQQQRMEVLNNAVY